MNSATPPTTTPFNNAAGPADTGQRIVIPVLAEQAQVHLEREHTGTVRVRKVVHQVTEPLAAQGYREVVETTRVPVNQVVEATEAPRTLGDLLVIPVYEERLVKQLVLVEEIHVRRRRESFEHTVAASLRREEVVIERLDPVTQQWVADRP
ncbi:YsnF/AvaK domain-containing protein [Polaromonas sp.]|uniref:YsnF/AvaK domain-containing protein n=1 Tax=Polaromonas sp. TaxID=1869339 RepID=UPI0013BD35A6|nr:YsnF/AvaK domain-containing protein [Polaromonas sp.]NDP62388.1 YsnF/AvaK domain-containing protein [Polaromonas sp.]